MQLGENVREVMSRRRSYRRENGHLRQIRNQTAALVTIDLSLMPGMAKLADAADLKSYRPHRLTHYLAVNNILIDMLSSRE